MFDFLNDFLWLSLKGFSISVSVCQSSAKNWLGKTIQALSFFLFWLQLQFFYFGLSLWWRWWRHIVIGLIFPINDPTLFLLIIVHSRRWSSLICLFLLSNKAKQTVENAKDSYRFCRSRGHWSRINGFRRRFGLVLNNILCLGNCLIFLNYVGNPCYGRIYLSSGRSFNTWCFYTGSPRLYRLLNSFTSFGLLFRYLTKSWYTWYFWQIGSNLVRFRSHVYN